MSERTKPDWLDAPIDERGYIDFSPEAIRENRERKAMAASLAKITRRRAFSAARRMAAVKYRRLPNWSFAMDLYGLGSTYAWGICVEMGIDPDATTATPWDDTPPPARPGATTETRW